MRTRRRAWWVAAAVPAVVVVAAVAAVALDRAGGTDDGVAEARAAADRRCERRGPRDLPRHEAADGLGTEVVSDLRGATTVAFHPSRPVAWVGTRDGVIWRVRTDLRLRHPVIDLSDDTSTGDDQGLLALTVDPAGRWLYALRTDGAGDSRLDAWPLDAEGRPGRAGRSPVLFVDQPRRMHNGGGLAFGPDGMLWVGLGDGGGIGDPDDLASDPDTLLGKLLRIRPTPEAGGYEVPADNPFVDVDGHRPEIWALGLRNPFRMTFQVVPPDGDGLRGVPGGPGDVRLWIGDVGQSCVEEVDVLVVPDDAGAHLGWRALEGTRPFLGDPPPGAVPPVFEYWHGGGWCAVIGGAVAPGPPPALAGSYVFADLCRPTLVAWDGRRITDLGVPAPRTTAVVTAPDGRLHVVSMEAGVLRLTDSPPAGTDPAPSAAERADGEPTPASPPEAEAAPAPSAAERADGEGADG